MNVGKLSLRQGVQAWWQKLEPAVNINPAFALRGMSMWSHWAHALGALSRFLVLLMEVSSMAEAQAI